MPTDAAEAYRDADGIIYPPLPTSGHGGLPHRGPDRRAVGPRLARPRVENRRVPRGRWAGSARGADLQPAHVRDRRPDGVAAVPETGERVASRDPRSPSRAVPRSDAIDRSSPATRPVRLQSVDRSETPGLGSAHPGHRVLVLPARRPLAATPGPRPLPRFGPAPGLRGVRKHDRPRTGACGRIVLEALRRAECRAVVLSGWAGLAGVTDPPRVHFVDSVPHNWLFPKTAAVVHHWGAGTTHAGLLAGAPTVVVPFFTDQPFWGARVADLGVGPRPIPRSDLSVDRMAASLRRTTRDSGMRVRARVIGERIRAEDRVAQAVRALCDMWPVA